MVELKAEASRGGVDGIDSPVVVSLNPAGDLFEAVPIKTMMEAFAKEFQQHPHRSQHGRASKPFSDNDPDSQETLNLLSTELQRLFQYSGKAVVQSEEVMSTVSEAVQRNLGVSRFASAKNTVSVLLETGYVPALRVLFFLWPKRRCRS